MKKEISKNYHIERLLGNDDNMLDEKRSEHELEEYMLMDHSMDRGTVPAFHNHIALHHQ